MYIGIYCEGKKFSKGNLSVSISLKVQGSLFWEIWRRAKLFPLEGVSPENVWWVFTTHLLKPLPSTYFHTEPCNFAFSPCFNNKKCKQTLHNFTPKLLNANTAQTYIAFFCFSVHCRVTFELPRRHRGPRYQAPIWGIVI